MNDEYDCLYACLDLVVVYKNINGVAVNNAYTKCHCILGMKKGTSVPSDDWRSCWIPPPAPKKKLPPPPPISDFLPLEKSPIQPPPLPLVEPMFQSHEGISIQESKDAQNNISLPRKSLHVRNATNLHRSRRSVAKKFCEKCHCDNNCHLTRSCCIDNIRISSNDNSPTSRESKHWQEYDSVHDYLNYIEDIYSTDLKQVTCQPIGKIKDPNTDKSIEPGSYFMVTECLNKNSPEEKKCNSQEANMYPVIGYDNLLVRLSLFITKHAVLKNKFLLA